MKFQEAVKTIYTDLQGILAIGVKTKNTPKSTEEVLINPAKFKL